MKQVFHAILPAICTSLPTITLFLGMFIGHWLSSAAARNVRRAGNPKRAKAQNLIRLATFPYKSGGPPSRANEWEKGNNSIDDN